MNLKDTLMLEKVKLNSQGSVRFKAKTASLFSSLLKNIWLFSFFI